MARNIMVTPEQLENTAGAIEDLAGEYQTQYKTIYNEADAMAASWTGEDNVAYINQIKGFQDDLQKMYNLMMSYADFLRKSAAAYRQTQDEITADAKRLVN